MGWRIKRRPSPGIRRDTVFVPFHWGGAACVNVLVSDALDPTSRMPEFKTCPVAVEKAVEKAVEETADDAAEKAPAETAAAQNGAAHAAALRT